MSKDFKIYKMAELMYQWFANPMGIDFDDLDAQSETKNSYLDLATEMYEELFKEEKC